MSAHVGIIGPSLFGKSHLGKALARQYWQSAGRRSVVLDLTGADWGPHALMIRDKDRFWEVVWRERDCAVFCDDFGDMMERDKSVTSLFTRLRHQGHQFHALTHVWPDMLPKQRNQLGRLFLFWQTDKSARIIADEWSDDRILESTKLPKYEFLYCVKHGENPGHKITRGRFPE
jgi:hypothetical protein